ncbi:MAG: hypothetical protein HC918_12460 [Oscillatoriales cyanobacterium SM2_1_8]|nr:hypothetical protein [Oscillatoriales cyanobacterium SM2_1_8]
MEKVDLSHLELPTLVVAGPQSSSRRRRPRLAPGDRPDRFVDRLLIVAALFSVLTTVLMWSLQKGLGWWQTEPTVAVAPSAPPADPVTAQFADTLRQSLTSLNTPSSPAPTAGQAPAPNVLPPINAVSGIQPIYIPVYQPPAVPPQALSAAAPDRRPARSAGGGHQTGPAAQSHSGPRGRRCRSPIPPPYVAGGFGTGRSSFGHGGRQRHRANRPHW